VSGTSLLATLDVSTNQLSGALPDLSAKTSLTALYVQSNRFTGALPAPPPNLAPHTSSVCPNPLTLIPGAQDNAWNTATGQAPWWGPASGGCDGIASGDFEQPGNGSFERGIENWHVESGACLWQTASAGAITPGGGQWSAPAAVDGNAVLISDNQNGGDCRMYQDVTVPAGKSSADFSAAVGYNVGAPWDERCYVDVSITTPAGDPIAPYITLTGATSMPLTQYAPATFTVHAGDVLRIAAHTTDLCGNYATGIVLDNVKLNLQ
jgi:hypothetical protein